ncbi:MAG TPA: NADPH-dependent glutamate synthase [Candidatus Syntrophoarchaeum butanivorans]|uniref:NADPH-dependent glutamate synthase n=1 Tax=Candidatus Syntropharchaeum butanivorans TaxID=1839936 RepID=A0A7J2S4I4_9EURY|nr:NADPH-dependent glutamate synthase [Candidatus Syntrophoarchaeum butanivorans]
MRKQDPARRIRNFDEVALGFDEDEAVSEAERCLQCPRPWCVRGCPVGVDIPGFIRAIRERRFEDGIRIIWEKNALPAVCGRVCPHEAQCEGLCALSRGCSRYLTEEGKARIDRFLSRSNLIHRRRRPVSIGALERFLADYAAANGIRPLRGESKKEGRVALVGSGPASLAAAGELSRMGYSVTVFEALHAPGGVLRYGIPGFRLPKEVVDREIKQLEEMGVCFRCDVVIGRTLTVEELLEDFDAVFIGSGAGTPGWMGIEGESLNGIYSANEFLTRVNLMEAHRFPETDTPISVGRRVATVGGGNVAMDAARTALRLGAEESIILYRRREEEMPARKEEIENAKEEGVRFELLVAPIRYIGDENGWVREVECIRMEPGEVDASGRARPVPVEGSEFRMEVDTVIVAIGQRPNPLIPMTTPGLELGRIGNIITDEDGRTSKEGVFAGGDIASGAATVILAMGAGIRAARAIGRYIEDRRKQRSDGKYVSKDTYTG